MRLFEILLAICMTTASLLFGFARGRTVVGFALAVCAIVLILHLLIEGYRLQAVPIYGGFLLLCLCAAWNPQSFWGRGFGGLICIGSCWLGALACYVYPVIRFPGPGGPYAIGTRVFYLHDPSRIEKYGSTPDGKRRFAIQIWYPAADCGGPRATYRDRAALIWKSAHLRHVRTHACIDAPFAPGQTKWPVVFFSPSSGGFRSQNTFMAEYLVSRGYIFVAFDHPDTSSRVVFPDKSVMHSLPDVWLDLTSHANMRRSEVKTTDILETNVADMRFTLDQLERSGPSDSLYAVSRYIDFSRVAAVGHSFGGAAAAEACRLDPRFRTGVNMDGWMFGEVNTAGVGKPFLFLVEGQPLDHPDEGPFTDDEPGLGREGDAQFFKAAQNSVAHSGGCLIRLMNANHGSFSDMALYVRPYPWRHNDGLDAQLGHHIVNELVGAFLDDELGRSNDLFPKTIQQNDRFIEAECGTLAPR